jgi:hypothetical protein
MDHPPGSSELELVTHGCFKIGDRILIGNEGPRVVVGFGSIIIDRPILAFLKKGTTVEKQVLVTPAPGQTLPPGSPTAVGVPTRMNSSGVIQARVFTPTEAEEESSGSGSFDKSSSSNPSGSLPGSWGGIALTVGLVGGILLVVLCLGGLAFMMSKKGRKKRGYGKVDGKAASSKSREVRHGANGHLVAHGDESYEAPLSQMSSDAYSSYASYAQPGYWQPQEMAVPSIYPQEPQYAQYMAPQVWPPQAQYPQVQYAPDAQGLMSVGQTLPTYVEPQLLQGQIYSLE